MCLACPMVAMGVGGAVATALNSSSTKFAENALNIWITTNLTSITAILVKSMFNISLCGGGTINLQGMIRVAGVTAIMGLIYSIGIKYLLKRYVFVPTNPNHN